MEGRIELHLLLSQPALFLFLLNHNIYVLYRNKPTLWCMMIVMKSDVRLSNKLIVINIQGKGREQQKVGPRNSRRRLPWPGFANYNA